MAHKSEPPDPIVAPAGGAIRAASSRQQQCADAVLMVRPVAFGYNSETAASNSFQPQQAPEAPGAAAAARQEFEELVRALESEGIRVCAVEDTTPPAKPDAVFPNNWVSFHEDGTLVLYPMQSVSRRSERRREVIEQAVRELGFRIARELDLTPFEREDAFLEGTGSLVLDHAERVAYACLSPRTHRRVLEHWARELGYEAVTFTATDRAGAPLYHTNVMLAIGARFVVVGTDAIVPSDRERVLARLRASGREVIEIGNTEIAQFAGNILELGTWDEALGDARVLVMSDSARRTLAPESYAQLSGSTDAVLAVPVPTIERLGGGSVRCMLAEVFRRA
ncbi:MAG: amidinotransferase [Gammaproteobacteria bacterium]|nr:amidinotransferase [Gammaproteobacteria bacterium]